MSQLRFGTAPYDSTKTYAEGDCFEKDGKVCYFSDGNIKSIDEDSPSSWDGDARISFPTIKPSLRPYGQPTKSRTIEYAEGDLLKVGNDEVPIKDIINLVKMMKENPEFSSAFI